MPKQTFFNLPDDKRSGFIETCVEEFALHDYRSASVSRIVEKAGIAKGSVYQYFENKLELYLYLVEYVSALKLSYIRENLSTSGDDFFLLYKAVIFTSARFDLTHLRYSRFLYNVGRETSTGETGNAPARLMENSIAYVTSLLEPARERGRIRADVPLPLLAFVVSYLSVDIGEYISRKFNFSYFETLSRGGTALPVSNEELGGVLDDLIKVLRTGLTGEA